MSAVSLVISDVDGTLVAPDKTLTDASIRAVHQLHARGIGFTVISSRPPFGLRMLIEPLALALPSCSKALRDARLSCVTPD